MKIRQVFDFDTTPVSLRRACDMSRACRPICASPISPSISARGTSAATESTTTTSTPPERTSTSTISSACSPLSGCDTSRLSRSTPSLRAYWASSACSASTNAAMPPSFCASAMICSVRVVLPDDSGPKISTTRPRGTPPMPRAKSRLTDPVEMDGIDRDGVLLAQPHDRALAELFLDLADGEFDGFEAFAVLTVVCRRHSGSLIVGLGWNGILGVCRGESQAKMCAG